ncbi:MAG: efflux RND transporter periplasmic adaptor subunit, partial [Anaeromyxobacteraceae bacterium]|nr:efflux RND transporter periplasmic adaptor subunit [Anaeromyxobacteraceae bacterium]
GAIAPATLGAARRATLATRLAAQVRAVHVELGQAVQAGQLLVSLADADVRGGLAAAEAGLAAAATHERRIQALLATRAATPSELEQAVAQRAQAEAMVAAARSNLAYSEIRAPFAGTVQARRVDPGDLVGPGQPMIDLEGDGLELSASLSAVEARGLAVGATVRFVAPAGRGTARVTALTEGGDPVSHRRSLKARVVTSEGELRSGAFTRLELPGAGGGGTFVPRSALVERGDLTGVFVAAGGRAELRWLSLGEPAGDVVAVRAGLRPGDQVVDAPGALKDGQPVEVLP